MSVAIWINGRISDTSKYKNVLLKFVFLVTLAAYLAGLNKQPFPSYIPPAGNLALDLQDSRIYLETPGKLSISIKNISILDILLRLVQIPDTICFITNVMGKYDEDLFDLYYRISQKLKNAYRNSNLNNDEIKKSRRYRLAKILAKESEGYHGSEKTKTLVPLVRELHNLVKTLYLPPKEREPEDNLILVVGKSGMGKSLALLTLALGFVPFSLKYMDSFRWWKYVVRTPDRLPVYVRLVLRTGNTI